jgi:muramoyltetrapeptide carboxypeptidase LdcA involved in peptidoglycan recycling
MSQIPPKISPGDEVRVITLSASLATKDQAAIDATVNTIDKLFGASVTFGQRSREQHDHLATSPVEARIEDLEAALGDQNVTAIIAAAGGDSVNQLLPYINWRLFKKYPKILLGFSDLTVLFNAIYRRSGLVTYYGPNAGFGDGRGQRYTSDYLQQVLGSTRPVSIEPSKTWYDKDYQPRQHASVNIVTMAGGRLTMARSVTYLSEVRSAACSY